MNKDLKKALADAPLFVFHILEWMDVPYELNVAELNERWALAENVDGLLQDPDMNRSSLVDEFIQPPLFATQYERSFGTLDTVAYNPKSGVAEFIWPSQSIKFGFDQFKEQIVRIELQSSLII